MIKIISLYGFYFQQKGLQSEKILLDQSYLYGLLITWYFGTIIKYFTVLLFKFILSHRCVHGLLSLEDWCPFLLGIKEVQ